MRVLYVGNFVPEHSTENDIRRAFEHLGWTVDTVQETDFTRAIVRGAGRISAIHRRAMDCDLVLHTMTQGSYPEPRRVIELWDLCERKGIPTASVHLDLFYGLSSKKETGPQRCDLPRLHPMFKVAHVFTADGGHADEFARDGVNHHWLPPGVRYDEAIDIDPVEWDVGYEGASAILDDIAFRKHDGRPYLVGFAGSANPDDPKGGYHPEHRHRDELVRWLRDEYKDRFLWIGGVSTPRITGLALNRVLASVPVWVGDSCLTRPDFAYWSDRVPETWGRGGFLVHPLVFSLDEHYYSALDYGERVPGDRWQAGDWNALRKEIEHWLWADEERAELQRRLASYTRRFDTYVNRVQTMLGVIGFTERTTDADA